MSQTKCKNSKVKIKTNYINWSYLIFYLTLPDYMYSDFSTPHLFLYCQSGTEPVIVQRCLRMRSIRPSVCIRMTRDSAGLGERVPSCSARASPPTHSPRSRRLTSRDRTNGGRQIRALTRNLQQPLRCQPISWGGQGDVSSLHER